VCTSDDQLPGNAPEALRMLESALDYLNGPLTGELPAGARGEALVGGGGGGGGSGAGR
jgi:hypothetical protein